MTNRDLTLGVTIKMTDGLSGPSAKALSTLNSQTAKSVRNQRADYEHLAKARETLGIRSEHTIQREIQRTEAAYRRLTQSGQLNGQELARAAEQMRAKVARLSSEMGKPNASPARAQRSEYEHLAKARETLGIRSEHSIQREIQRTEAAYRRLAQSGQLSWQQQARAAEQMRRQVTQLTNEIGKLTAAQKLGAGGRAVVGGVAAGVAAAYVIKPAAEKAMSYDLRLAHMANTAFAEKDATGRKAGARGLDQTIISAVRKGGGTRDQAAETLDALIASGAMNVGDASGMLPTLMKSATASGADPKELANIAIRGMQTFKIKAQDLPDIIDMAITAGQAGGFELKDMAKWLPQQMAAAQASGMSGTKGFAKLASLNQAAVITAGTKDEAGNNLVNLLAKINSSDTAKDAEKLGINLPQYLARKRAKGVDSIDAFVGLVDQTVSKQTAWKQLQAKLKSAKDDSEKRETLESMASIVQGAGVGKLVQDRQALMALVAIMNNREYLTDVQSKTLNGAGAADKNFDVISDTASFRTGQAGNEKEIAQQRAMDQLTPSIGALADKTVELAREYPALTMATVSATGALAALAAAAGAAGLSSILTGGGTQGGGAIGGALKGAGGMLKTAGGFMLKRALPLWGAWEGGQAIGTHVVNPMINGAVSWATGKNNSLAGAIYDVTHREETKVGGDIRIRVDQEGRVSAVQARTDNSRVPMNVDVGYSMVAP